MKYQRIFLTLTAVIVFAIVSLDAQTLKSVEATNQAVKLNDRGVELAEAEKFTEAAELQKAVNLQPQNPHARLVLGQISA